MNLDPLLLGIIIAGVFLIGLVCGLFLAGGVAIWRACRNTHRWHDPENPVTSNVSYHQQRAEARRLVYVGGIIYTSGFAITFALAGVWWASALLGTLALFISVEVVGQALRKTAPLVIEEHSE